MDIQAATSRFVPLACLFLTLSTGCASYNQKTAGAFNAFLGGRFEAAVTSYADTDTTGSTFLSGAEAGTAAMAAGDWEAAIEHFQRAASFSEEIEGRALAGASNLAEGLTSWIFNEGTQAYQGEGFERVYVHACLGLCYLAQGRLEDVYVEARRANALLEAEEELYEVEYQAGGFGHLLSALAYEFLGERDQAWIDYQRMLDKGAAPELAGRAMQRLAPHLTRADEAQALLERFGPHEAPPENYANVILLAGVGLAPEKLGDTLAVPTGNGFFQMSVPRYQFWNQPVAGLRLLHEESGLELDSVLVENVEDVASRNLSDRLTWMSAKSIARGVGKVALTNHLGDEHGPLAELAGNLFTMLTEQADLRAWRTLPANWHAARLFVPPGVSSFRLTAIGGEAIELEPLLLDAGESLIIIARSIDRSLVAHVIGGTAVDLEPPSADTSVGLLPNDINSNE